MFLRAAACAAFPSGRACELVCVRTRVDVTNITRARNSFYWGGGGTIRDEKAVQPPFETDCAQQLETLVPSSVANGTLETIMVTNVHVVFSETSLRALLPVVRFCGRLHAQNQKFPPSSIQLREQEATKICSQTQDILQGIDARQAGRTSKGLLPTFQLVSTVWLLSLLQPQAPVLLTG